MQSSQSVVRASKLFISLPPTTMDADAYRSAQTQSGVSKFWAEKYARDSSKSWDKFYKRNKTNFYKDRHWTTKEDTDGFTCLSTGAATVVEAGCGVANLAFPLLEVNSNLKLYMFDFASSAVKLVQESEQYDTSKCQVFQWDFCACPLNLLAEDKRAGLQSAQADFVLLVFVLSAVPPDMQVRGLQNLFEVLKPGGRLLFRDYSTGDMAQTRFAKKNRIEDNYFVRQDSTLSYFFSEERVRHVMTAAGFQEVYVRRVKRVIKNRKENLEMHRVFLQAEFVKLNPDENC